MKIFSLFFNRVFLSYFFVSVYKFYRESAVKAKKILRKWIVWTSLAVIVEYDVLHNYRKTKNDPEIEADVEATNVASSEMNHNIQQTSIAKQFLRGKVSFFKSRRQPE
jgi:hypothetical protein